MTKSLYYEPDLDCCLANVAFVSGDPFNNDLGVNDDDDRKHQHETLEIELIHNYVSIKHMNSSDTYLLPRAEFLLQEENNSSTCGVKTYTRIDQAPDSSQVAFTQWNWVNTAATEQIDAKLYRQVQGCRGKAREEDKCNAEQSAIHLLSSSKEVNFLILLYTYL